MGLFGESIRILLNALETLIFIRIIFSFLNIGRSNVLTNLVYELTEPVLSPARALIEKTGIRTGMFDFSPIVAVLFLRILSEFIRINIRW